MRVGYARVSATDQHIEAQLERLSDCERIFSEKQSGSKVDRPQLEAALEFVREGDVLVATRLDRLARSVSHLCTVAEALRKKGVELRILDQAIDTATPTGKLLFHVLAAIAEFELSIRKEQQRAGIEYARLNGKPTGRRPKMSADDARGIQGGHALGWTVRSLAKLYHVDPHTVRRVLRGEGGYASLTRPDNSAPDSPTPVAAEA